jgi:hypothetical protein
MGFSILWILAVFGGAALAGPATTPSLSQTPTEALKVWAQLQDIESISQIYYATTDVQKHFAHNLALQTLAALKLEKAVAAKWGNLANTTVAHICQSDTPEDDATASAIVDGDHGNIIFKASEISSLPVVRVEGRWLIDVPTILKMLGSRANKSDQIVEESAGIYDTYTTDVNDGKFSTFEELTDRLQKKVHELNDAAR